MNNSKYLTTDQ